MPTPSASTTHLSPPAVPDDFAARTTCPPEVESLSEWSHSPDLSPADDCDAPDNSFSPVTDNPHAVLTRSNDGLALSTSDPVKVHAASLSSIGNVPKHDEDTAAGGLSPSGEPLRPPRQSPSLTSPSTTSLLSYEFSNVRVCPAQCLGRIGE